MNLIMLLEMAASGFGDRVAVQNGDDRITYEELYRAAGAAAADITASGARTVALLDVNSLAVPIGLFAAAWAGVPFAPLNYRLTGSELDALLDRIDPAYLITDDAHAEALAGRTGTTVVRRDAFIAKARAGEAAESGPAPDPDAIAILLFTSGTTGAPKAAVLRHRHLFSYIVGSVEFGGAAADDAALVSVPPYHIAGMASIASSVYAARRVVQLESFSPEAWVEAARREHVTNAMVVPTMLVRIVDALEASGDTALPDLRAVAYGGSKMPLPVIERAMELLPGTGFTNAYGLTETTSTITILTPDDHREAVASDDPDVRRRLVSLGRPLPGVEVEIRDELGVKVGPGVKGEIYVRGEQVSGEYLEQGSRLDAEGWFPTRDGGWLDADGYLFLEGRIDDIIVRGGENISPGEVEDTILAHEAVADCAVVGIPDDQWGEAVAAVIVPREGRSLGADEVREWVTRHLRSSRSPARVEFRDELPHTETGKLLRRVVRADLTDSD
ncbi:MAG: acyl--CoA ligase [Acidimicrobiia bacterium]|nr:acyl--CoA ligase [Acidimicrobiia bacterium]